MPYWHHIGILWVPCSVLSSCMHPRSIWPRKFGLQFYIAFCAMKQVDISWCRPENWATMIQWKWHMWNKSYPKKLLTEFPVPEMMNSAINNNLSFGIGGIGIIAYVVALEPLSWSQFMNHKSQITNHDSDVCINHESWIINHHETCIWMNREVRSFLLNSNQFVVNKSQCPSLNGLGYGICSRTRRSVFSSLSRTGATRTCPPWSAISVSLHILFMSLAGATRTCPWSATR